MQTLNEILAVNGITENLSREAQIEAIKGSLFDVNKYEVNAPRGGFDKPDVVTIYDENGRYLGKANSGYDVLKPLDFFSAIVAGLDSANFDYTKNKIAYKEVNKGKIIEFRIPLISHKLKVDADVNDIIDTYMLCSTSFDGTQASRSAILNDRLVCSNGMVIAEKKAFKTFKHTFNMNKNGLILTEAMAESNIYIDKFNEFAVKLSKVKMTQAEQNRMIERITGYNIKDYATMHVARKAIIDGIQTGLEFEKDKTGSNNTAWGLFNAFTYHTNHDLEGQKVNSKSLTLTTGTGFKLNNKIQKEFKSLIPA